MERRPFLKLLSSVVLVHCVRSKALAVGISDPALPPRAQRLECRWLALKKGKYISDLKETSGAPRSFAQFFVNGRKEILARFPAPDASGAARYVSALRFVPQGSIVPDFDDADCQHWTAVEFDPATFSQKRWSKPEEASIYLKTDGEDIRIAMRAIDYDRNLIWCAPNETLSSSTLRAVPRFYVENVYEELNTPREWYLNRQDGILYYRPPDDVDMKTAVIAVAQA